MTSCCTNPPPTPPTACCSIPPTPCCTNLSTKLAISPATQSVNINDIAQFSVNVSTGNQKIAAYGVDIAFDSTIMRIADTYGTSYGAEAGADGFLSMANASIPGLIKVTGFDTSGKGPGTNLELFKVYFYGIAVGTSYLNPAINTMVDESYRNINISTLNSGSVTVTGCCSSPTPTRLPTVMPSQTVTQRPTGTPTRTLTATPSITPMGDIGKMWIEPAVQTVNCGSAFQISVHCNSGTQMVAAYGIKLNFTDSIITPNTSIGMRGVEAGAQGFVSAASYNLPGNILITGFDTSGKGPGNSLEICRVNFTTLTGISGTADITLKINTLTDEDYNDIGDLSSATGAKIVVTCASPTPSGTVAKTPAVSGTPMPTSTTTAKPTLPTDGAGTVSIKPANQTYAVNTPARFIVNVNSGLQILAAYGIDINYPAALMQIDTSSVQNGVEVGRDGFVTSVNNNTPGLLKISGFDTIGKGPGSELQLCIVNFYGIAAGTAVVTLQVNTLVDENYQNIGILTGTGANFTFTGGMTPSPTATRTLTATPTLSLPPLSFRPYVDFGKVQTGSTTERELTLSNNTSAAITLVSGSLTNGNVFGRGLNMQGTMGAGNVAYGPPAYEPVMASITDVKDLFSSYMSTYFIKNDTSLWSSGANVNGELGTGSTVIQHIPMKVMNSGAAKVAPGYFHTLVLKTDGSLWGMGANYAGQLGLDNMGSQVLTPTLLVSGGVADIAAGAIFSAYVRDDGSLWTLNLSSANGATGTFVFTNQILSSDVVKVAAQSSQLLFIKTDGSVWVCSINTSDAQGAVAASPVKIMDSGVTALACGTGHCLMLKNDGSVWGWGSNKNGQLGTNNTLDATTPLQIIPAGISKIKAGYEMSLFLTTDNVLLGCGDNGSGQLSVTQPQPVKEAIVIDRDVIAFAGAITSTMVVKKPDPNAFTADATLPLIIPAMSSANLLYAIQPQTEGYHKAKVEYTTNSQETIRFELKGDSFITLPAAPVLPPVVSGPGTVSMTPQTLTVNVNANFTTDLYLDSGTSKVAAYSVYLRYDPAVLAVNNSVGSNGVTAGADGFIATPNSDIAGIQRVVAYDTIGKGPGANLHMLTFAWTAVAPGITLLTPTSLSARDAMDKEIGTPQANPGLVTVIE